MKILITNTGPWGTGSFTVAKAVMEELVDMGHEVKIFFPDTQLPCKDLKYYYDKKDVFKIWKFPIKNKKVSINSFPLIITDPHPRNPNGITYLELTKEQKNFYFKELEKELKKVVEEFKPDIVECQHIWAFDNIIHKLNLPYICVAHHSDQMGFKYDHTIQDMAIEGAHNAKYIFAISNFVKKEVVSLYGVNPQKVIVLSNGYDKKIFQPRKLNRSEILKKYDLDIPNDAKIISFAGKISKTKGIDILLKANNLIDKTRNIHFVVLGAGKINKVISQKDEKNCDFANIHFLGHQPMRVLSEIHNISDFSVLPSRNEGFGIACLEAMGCALPVIVTKTGGLEDYAVGEIIEADNYKILAEAIKRICSLSKNEYDRLSKKAIDAAKTFSWTSITQERINYYSKVLNRGIVYD